MTATTLATPASSQSRPHKFINHSPENYEEKRRLSAENKQISLSASPQQRKPLASECDNVQPTSSESVKLETSHLQTPALQNGEKSAGSGLHKESIPSNLKSEAHEGTHETQDEHPANLTADITAGGDTTLILHANMTASDTIANTSAITTANTNANTTSNTIANTVASTAANTTANTTANITGNTTVDMTANVTSAESPDRTVALNIFTPDYSTIAKTSSSGSSAASLQGSATSASSPLVMSGSPSQYNRGSNPSSRNNSITQDPTKEYKDPPRKRRRTSPDELQILEFEFSRNSRPCKEDRERIAALTSKDEKAVQVWFQNKRQSCRRQQNGCGMVRALVRSISYSDDAPAIPPAPVTGAPANTVGAVPGMISAMATHSMPAATNMHSTAAPAVAVYHPGLPNNSLANGIPSPIPHPPMGYYTWPPSPPLGAHPLHNQPTPDSRSGSFPHHQHQNTQDHENSLGSIGAGLKLHENQNPPEAKRTKSLKLSMSADGKAEIVERSPLKVLNSNRMPAPALRFATMPAFAPLLSGYEQECASSLLVLKSGHW